MKNQDEEFKAVRAKIRNYLIMTRLGLKNQTYQKILSQQVNGKYDSPLMEWEVIDFYNALEKVEIVILEMKNELYRKD